MRTAIKTTVAVLSVGGSAYALARRNGKRKRARAKAWRAANAGTVTIRQPPRGVGIYGPPAAMIGLLVQTRLAVGTMNPQNDPTYLNLIGTWGKSVGQIFGNIGGWITNIVVGGLASIVADMWDFIADGLFDVLLLAKKFTNAAEQELRAAMTSTWNGVLSVVENMIDAARATFDAMISGLRWLPQAVTEILAQLQDLAGWVAEIAMEIFDDIVQPIIGSLRDWIESALAEIWSGLDWMYDGLEEFISNLVVGMLRTNMELLEWIVDAGLSFGIGYAGSSIAILRGAWNALVWLAEHPFDAIPEMLEIAMRELLEANYTVARAVIENGSDEIERMVAHLLGINP